MIKKYWKTVALFVFIIIGLYYSSKYYELKNKDVPR